ncbi:hypothetical protein [Endozoicomonas sp. 8E]|uniref:hypothetical protein n=1 Tax=Endozoicomonas sp. 8E TaxID=3035692 RepID=UPI002938F6CF|nr:hypothetical protein [Endozoicomonas sp. 8E]WOG28263.1 hypothetical protein P6910_01030 [Endozoicomonas sp. 8E]
MMFLKRFGYIFYYALVRKIQILQKRSQEKNMDVTELNSGLFSKDLTRFLNEPESKGSPSFKNRTIKIVVATRQYMGDTILDRGYGDIASGVRELGYVRKLFPEATCSFVFEHHAADIDELNRLRCIATFDDVKTFILNGRHQQRFRPSEQQQLTAVHQEEEVCQLLHEANFILHGPSGLIAPLANSNGKFASKTVGLSEYEIKSGQYSYTDRHGIEEIGMGFSCQRLYLMENTYPDTVFKDDLLRKYCANPLSKSSDGNDQSVFYFVYGHDEYFLAQALRTLVLMEGNNDRDVVLVSSRQLNPGYLSEFSSEQQPDFFPYRSVNLFKINSDDNKGVIMTFQNPDGQQEKNINIITPGRIVNSDFDLLQQGSVINWSSGDISLSDVLAKGKIPIVDHYKKGGVLFRKMVRAMEKFCAIPGNEQYGSLMAPWKTAGANLPDNTIGSLMNNPDKRVSLQQLLGSQWQAFERDFTDWLKKNNQTESFIREKAEAIIRKTLFAEKR